MSKLMKCGCAPNAVCSGIGGKKFDPPIPSCAIHDCIEPAEDTPSLEGRKARCAYGDKIVDSKFGLAFFKYRGPESQEAVRKCKCGFFDSAHTEEKRARTKEICENFTPHGGYEYDEYYCGCYGWD